MATRGLALGAVILLTVACMCKPPSDDALIEQYGQHKDELNALATMMQQDSQLFQIDGDTVYQPNASSELSGKRVNEYRERMKKAGVLSMRSLTAGRQSGEFAPRPVYFQVHLCRTPVEGPSKGFAYAPGTMELQGNTVPDLEGKEGPSNGQPFEFRELEGQWFLYRDRH